MKKLSIILTTIFFVIIANAQSIGIGTVSPSASAMLDVSSTSKGLLMPRLTSAQRIVIASPATGLMVFDTDTKTLWAYDGTVWKNLYTSGGGLVLPFSQTVNTGTSAFLVTNQGTGAAIEGSSTAQFGTGITAKATGDGGWGLLAFSNGAGSQSVRSYADNGTAYHGENNNPANTNTLLNLLNKGVGKTGSFQLTNSNSTAFNVQIAGNHLGEQLKVYQTNASNTAAAVSIENSGTGNGLYALANNGTGISGNSTSGTGVLGTSSTGYGLKGESNSSGGFAGVRGDNTGSAGSGVIGASNAVNTQGVYGTSTNGIGVRAASGTSRALQAVSTSGTGVYASSTSGLALETVGNIKISGGNTTPANGFVLTSDATGNATWKLPASDPKVAFRCYGISSFSTAGTPNNEFSDGTFKKVEFNTKSFDSPGNNFLITGSSVATSTSSTYIVPLDAVYHFSATVTPKDNLIFNYLNFTIRLRLNRGGSISTMAEKGLAINHNLGSSISIDSDFSLLQDDIIWLEYKQANTTFTASNLETSGILGFISGHMIYKL